MGTPRSFSVVLCGILLGLSAGCAREVAVHVPVLTPPRFDLTKNGLKRLSVAEFEGESQAGLGIAGRVRAELAGRPAGIALLEWTRSGSPAPDAVIMGRVDAFYDRQQVQNVETTYSYSTTEVRGPDGKPQKVETKHEVPVSITVARVTGAVRVEFRVVENSTSRILFSDVLQANWQQQESGLRALDLPLRPVLVETLAKRVTIDLANRLTPHIVVWTYRLKNPGGEVGDALELIRQNRWPEAENAFEFLVRKYPNDSNAFFSLGAVKEILGLTRNDPHLLEQAERAYQTALSLGGRGPHFSDALTRVQGFRKNY